MFVLLTARQSPIFTMSYPGEPKPRVSQVEQTEMVRLHALGVSQTAIGKMLGRHTTTVGLQLQRFNKAKKGRLPTPKARKYKLRGQVKTQLLRAIERKKLVTLTSMLAWLKEKKKIKVARQTLREALKRWGCHGYIPQRKPAHSSQGLQDRAARCSEWRHYQQSDWDVVIFSDEHSFNQNNNSNPRERQYSTRALKPHERPTRPHYPFGGINVSIWAAISHKGFLAFDFYDQALTGPAYLKILKAKLIKNASKVLGRDSHWRFQQDNAPWHTDHNVMRWLEDKDVDLLDWPPNSPDLNPIENVWAEMNRKLATKKFANREELKMCVTEIITEMNAEEPHTHYFKKLYLTMPKRVKQVLEAQGGPAAF